MWSLCFSFLVLLDHFAARGYEIEEVDLQNRFTVSRNSK
jgi:hypothetical protein